MDSWSRPSKTQATPVPFYLLPGGASTPYCHSCGRVIGSRKKTASTASGGTLTRYCSSRCRARKPGKRDRLIEEAFVRFLTGAETAPSLPADEGPRQSARPRKAKGDPRILVSCRVVEDAVFGPARAAPARPIPPTAGSGGGDDAGENDIQEVAEEREALNTQHSAGGHTPPADVPAGSPEAQLKTPDRGVHQTPSESGGVEEDEQDRANDTEGDGAAIEKRRQGQLRAQEREMVRCAARRGVVFGFLVPAPEERIGRTGLGRKPDTAEEGERRLCEAVMAGKVVEPSFAKGDWGIRWRE